MDPSGKKVLLTGATGGLGRAIANKLAGAGAELILSARSAEALEEMASSLPGSGHAVQAADLGRPGAAIELAQAAGPVDILVGNAALPSTGRLTELTDEQVARMLRINLEAPILIAQALLPGMQERGRGKLVMIGSLAGKAGSPRSSIYNATKFGLRGFVFGLAADLAGGPVGATLVAPGFVREAGMFADSGADAPAGMGTTTPERVAAAVLKAIGSNRVEIAVAPLVQRSMAHLGLMSPHLSHRVQSGSAGQNAADSLARGQTDKR
ncbi:MAG: SDR family NAD(P)-dependent oxidoreductase [Solirubrobacterales bacterium]|nr:SDR family NAD(P)-dependent oxidoreductase [Solirubrobacterales bacterium]